MFHTVACGSGKVTSPPSRLQQLGCVGAPSQMEELPLAWLCTPPLRPPYCLAVLAPNTCALSSGMASQPMMRATEVQVRGPVRCCSWHVPPCSSGQAPCTGALCCSMQPLGQACKPPWAEGKGRGGGGRRGGKGGEREEQGERHPAAGMSFCTNLAVSGPI